MSESKAERSKRIAADNFLANEVTPFEYESDLFGPVKVGENLGPSDVTDGWDVYDVEHSGVHHRWTSSVIVGIFGGAS